MFSAGHDGQINQYVITYSAPSFDRLAEPHHHSSPVGTDSHTIASSSIPVDLTIVTTYATAPVTAVSDFWVGSAGEDDGGRGVEGNGEAGPRREAGGEKVRLVVSGRSGSSRMSVWDITEARQILEVRHFCCKHLGGCLSPFSVIPQTKPLSVLLFPRKKSPRCRLHF